MVRNNKWPDVKVCKLVYVSTSPWYAKKEGGGKREAGLVDILLYGRRSNVSKAFLEAEQLGRLVTGQTLEDNHPLWY